MHMATPSIWLVQGLLWWVVQCLRIHLLMQGKWIRSLVRERSHMLWSNEGQAATSDPMPSRAHCCDKGSCLPQWRSHMLQLRPDQPHKWTKKSSFSKKDYLFIWMKQKMKKNSKATSAMYQTLSTMTRSPLHSGSWRQNRGGGRKAILLFWEAPSHVYHLRPAYLNDSGEKVYMPSIYRLTLGSQCLILHVNCRSSLVLWCLLRSAWGNQTSSNSKLCCLFYSQSLKLRKGKEKKLIRALGISSSWNFPLLET